MDKDNVKDNIDNKQLLGKKRKEGLLDKIEWMELPEYRKEGYKDTRRLYYICKRCNMKIGQMEAVSRHYSDYHPLYLKDLRNLVGIKEYMICQAKIYINLITSGLIKYEDIKDYSFFQLITEMIFDKKTMAYIKLFKQGKYTKYNSTIFSNIDSKSIKEYINFVRNYLNDFDDCLEEINFRIPNNDNVKELKELNLFNSINLDLNQKENKQGYFFINKKAETYEDYLKEIQKRVETNIINIKQESNLFPNLKNIDIKNLNDNKNNIINELKCIEQSKTNDSINNGINKNNIEIKNDLIIINKKDLKINLDEYFNNINKINKIKNEDKESVNHELINDHILDNNKYLILKDNNNIIIIKKDIVKNALNENNNGSKYNNNNNKLITPIFSKDDIIHDINALFNRNKHLNEVNNKINIKTNKNKNNSNKKNKKKINITRSKSSKDKININKNINKKSKRNNNKSKNISDIKLNIKNKAVNNISNNISHNSREQKTDNNEINSNKNIKENNIAHNKDSLYKKENNENITILNNKIIIKGNQKLLSVINEYKNVNNYRDKKDKGNTNTNPNNDIKNNSV